MAEDTGLEKITSKIIGDANLKAQQIAKEAEDEAEAKRKKAKERGERIKHNLIEESKKLVEQERRRKIADATIKARTLKLETMETLIAKAFEEAEKKLDSFDERKYAEVLEKMIAEACAELGTSEVKAMISEQDAKKISRERIEKEAEKTSGKKVKVEFEAKKDSSRGAVVRTGDGSIYIDATFETRLSLVRQNSRVEIAKILFGLAKFGEK